jgi:hypothetical protein
MTGRSRSTQPDRKQHKRIAAQTRLALELVREAAGKAWLAGFVTLNERDRFRTELFRAATEHGDAAHPRDLVGQLMATALGLIGSAASMLEPVAASRTVKLPCRANLVPESNYWDHWDNRRRTRVLMQFV